MMDFMFIDGDDENSIWLQKLAGNEETLFHERKPLAVASRVVEIDVIVVVAPVLCTGVVGRINVDDIDLAGMRVT